MSFEAVPLEPRTVLWEGELSLRTDLAAEGTKGVLHRTLSRSDLEGALPAVTIGKPEVLRSVSGIPAPSGFERIGRFDFYLVRLWCSFRPESDFSFDRAHFKVALSPSDGEAALIAHDMYPNEVLYEVERNVNVSLSPELTFSEVGGKLGGLQYGFSYTELQPEIQAAGQRQSDPSWTFSRTKGHELAGGKAVHMVVAAPAEAPEGNATLDLIAFVRKPNKIPLPMGLLEKRGPVAGKPLTVRLW